MRLASFDNLPRAEAIKIAGMNWIESHHFSFGVLADILTFLGACLLTRDGFRRLIELKSKRIDVEFRREFPRLNLTDDEWNTAMISMRWTLAGFGLLVLGFSCQLILRLAERHS